MLTRVVVLRLTLIPDKSRGRHGRYSTGGNLGLSTGAGVAFVSWSEGSGLLCRQCGWDFREKVETIRRTIRLTDPAS
jgi:hypothetical protein